MNNVVRECTGLASDHDAKGGGIASVVLFCILIIIFLVIFPIITFFVELTRETKSDDEKVVKIVQAVLVVLETLAGIFYFYGDNILIILKQHGVELKCGEGCVENAEISAVIFLGLALLLYASVNLIVERCVKIAYPDLVLNTLLEDSTVFSVCDMIFTIVKVDALYTAVAIMTQTDSHCGKSDFGISIAFICICCVAGIVSITLDIVILYKSIDLCWEKCSAVALAFLLSFILIAYLLVDNQQPLDCFFKCDFKAANKTLNDAKCEKTANHITRIAITGFFTTVVMVFWCIICCVKAGYDTYEEKTKNSKSK